MVATTIQADAIEMHGILHKLRDIKRLETAIVEVGFLLWKEEGLGSLAILIYMTDVRHRVETI